MDSADGDSSFVSIPGLPLEFGDERTRLSLQRQPPGLGEHTREVLQENGFAAAGIEDLLANRIAV